MYRVNCSTATAAGQVRKEQQVNPYQQQQQRRPNYAIVRLPEGTDVLRFYQLLLENGYPEVSFVNQVRENGTFLPHGPGGAQTASAQQEKQQIYNGETNNNNKTAMRVKTEEKKGNTAASSSTRRSTTACAAANNSNSNVSPPQQQQPQQPQQNQTSPQTSSRARTAVVHIAGGAAAPPLANQQRVKANGDVMPTLSAASPASSASSTIGTAAVVPATKKGEENGAVTSATSKVEEYATCLLCNNRIMSSRLSNLTNHVRRHASLKQYRCPHCMYAHNEMAKVRLHMSHNHQDFSSQPVDTLTFEMQLQWGLLMEQCFPEHAKRFGPSAANSQFRNLEELQKYVDMERQYTCIECGEVLSGYRLVSHLEDVHRQECIPFACGQCGYQSSSQWKVRLHISVKHPERAAETTVASLPEGSNYMLFLQKFFAEVHIPAEEDEAKLMAELQEKNSDQLLAAMNAFAEENGEGHEAEEGNEDAKNGTSNNDLLLALAPSPPLLQLEDEEEENKDEVVEKQHEVKREFVGDEEDRSMGEEDGETEDVQPIENMQNGQKQQQKTPEKKSATAHKRERPSTGIEEGCIAQPAAKRHNLRHSNRLMAAEKRRTVAPIVADE